MVSHSDERERIQTGGMPAGPQLQAGFVLDGIYEIESLIGSGGMCMVYRARHIHLDKPVAVKLLKPGVALTAGAVERFRREAVSVASLEQANIVRVFGFGVFGDRPYMALELLEGISLAELLKSEHQLKREVALPVFLQICDALSYAHGKGIVHRDLKPSNIMLSGTPYAVKVLDFGIAKLMPESGKEIQKLTQTGELFGTVAYMSPEQCLGRSVDARSDIYSLGCLMYEVLTGSLAFQADSPFASMHKRLSENPPANAALSGKLEQVILSALNREPDKRPSSANQLKQALLDPDSFKVEWRKPAIPILPLAVVSAVVAAMVAAMAVMLFLIDSHRHQHDIRDRSSYQAVTENGREPDGRKLLDRAVELPQGEARTVLLKQVRNFREPRNIDSACVAANRMSEDSRMSGNGVPDAEYFKKLVDDNVGSMSSNASNHLQMEVNQCMFLALEHAHRGAEAEQYFEKQLQITGESPSAQELRRYASEAFDFKVRQSNELKNLKLAEQYARKVLSLTGPPGTTFDSNMVGDKLRGAFCNREAHLVVILVHEAKFDEAIKEQQKANTWISQITDPGVKHAIAQGVADRAAAWYQSGQPSIGDEDDKMSQHLSRGR